MEKLAVIDLGSNSIRMSIFEIESEFCWRQTGNFRNMIKLSEGMTGDMMLRPDAQLRAVNAVLEYKQIMKKEGVTHLRAVATAAVRKAKNGREFLKDVKEATGITIEVIDGETEAALDCLATANLLDCKKGIICDIGGGSTEFIAINCGEIMKPAISIPMGSRSITEMFFSEGEDLDALNEANAYVDKRISELPWLEEMKDAPVIGIGGTLRALAKYYMADSSNTGISRCEIEAQDIERLFEVISQSSISVRAQMPGIGAERADIILGGLLPLMCLKEKISAPKLVVADLGIREGVLFDFLKTNYKNA